MLLETVWAILLVAATYGCAIADGVREAKYPEDSAASLSLFAAIMSGLLATIVGVRVAILPAWRFVDRFIPEPGSLMHDCTVWAICFVVWFATYIGGILLAQTFGDRAWRRFHMAKQQSQEPSAI